MERYDGKGVGKATYAMWYSSSSIEAWRKQSHLLEVPSRVVEVLD